MRIKRTFHVIVILLFIGHLAASQTFWFENWVSCTCNQGCTTYTGPNGAWSTTATGANGAGANLWFFSYQEQAMGRGQCGSATGSNATAHVGSQSTAPNASLFCPTGDCGAAYDFYAGAPSDLTNTRLQSPTINCSGHTSITLTFNYIMNGLAGSDYATVWYYNGVSWALLASPAATTVCGGGQGLWTNYSVALPASANNNPAIQIGFNLQNGSGTSGSDPSFAVDSISLSVVVPVTPVANFSVNDSTICAGDSIHFIDKSTNNPTSWQWTFTAGTPASSVIQNPWVIYKTPGVYPVKLVVKNSNGADSLTKNAYINVLSPPKITLTGATTICKGDSTTLVASGGKTYNWSTGSTIDSITVSPANTTTYTLGVSNGSCVTDTNVVITVTAKPVIHITVNPTPDCPGSPVAITANGGFSYVWSTGATTSSITVSPATTITYSVTGKFTYCSVKDTVTVPVYSMSVTACCNATIQAGVDIVLTLNGLTTGDQVTWFPSAGLSCTNCPNPTASPDITTVYVATVTNDTTGCVITDSVTITVIENCGEVFVPTAFSPNNDGQNDILYVKGGCIKTMTFQIFDRWGNRVFFSDTPSNGWNGMHNGQLMNTGVYVYSLVARLFNNTTVSKKGNITLAR